jgi:uncharacterized protein YndB with AHSA1/START domain
LTEPPLTTARVEQILPARPDAAYDAWLDEDALREFMCPHPGRVSEASVEARIGGSLRVVMTFSDHSREITGEFIALDRPERLSFTWHTDVDEHGSVVTVLFAPHGDEQTHMTILHTRLLPPLVPSYQGGWTSIAEALAGHLAG